MQVSLDRAVVTSFRETDKGRQWIEFADGEGKLVLTSTDVDMRRVDRLTPVSVSAVVRPEIWGGGKLVLTVLSITVKLLDGKPAS